MLKSILLLAITTFSMNAFARESPTRYPAGRDKRTESLQNIPIQSAAQLGNQAAFNNIGTIQKEKATQQPKPKDNGPVKHYRPPGRAM